MAREPQSYFPCDTNIDSPKRNAPTTMMSAPAWVVFSFPSARDHVETPTRTSPAAIRTVPTIAGRSLMLMRNKTQMQANKLQVHGQTPAFVSGNLPLVARHSTHGCTRQ